MVIVILSVAIIVAYQSKVGEERSERERERRDTEKEREDGESRGEREEREGGGRESVKAVGRPLLVMRAVGRPLVLDVRCSCVVHVAR